ncbi:S-layer homology domain-containing protein [Bacillus litorisediminis]|uniref:S-layer homology domain-containing protein n=1 Tax=Bacillus litorisediminis TaxID=2922713 RepID=UPI001FAC14C6|nr:S-layer homology domain-containing protein [Bacillus litorisediminis]
MKWMLAICIVVSIIIGGQTVSANSGFDDVGNNMSAYDEIMWLKEQGIIIEPLVGNNFYPNKQIELKMRI